MRNNNNSDGGVFFWASDDDNRDSMWPTSVYILFKGSLYYYQMAGIFSLCRQCDNATRIDSKTLGRGPLIFF